MLSRAELLCSEYNLRAANVYYVCYDVKLSHLVFNCCVADMCMFSKALLRVLYEK